MEREQIEKLVESLNEAFNSKQDFISQQLTIPWANCKQFADQIEEDIDSGYFLDDDFKTDIDILESIQETSQYVDRLNELTAKLYIAIVNADLREYNKCISDLSEFDDTQSALALAGVFFKNYSSYNPDYLAKLLELAIRKKMSWAQINSEKNPLFRLCIILGSKDLYDCFIEETIPPDEDWYYKLYDEAIELDEEVMTHLHSVRKGVDYNGCLKTHDNKSPMVQIWREDYNFIESIIVKYNGIIERKRIIEDLSIKCGINEL